MDQGSNQEAVRLKLSLPMLRGLCADLDPERELASPLRGDVGEACFGSRGITEIGSVLSGALEDVFSSYLDVAIHCGLARPPED